MAKWIEVTDGSVPESINVDWIMYFTPAPDAVAPLDTADQSGGGWRGGTYIHLGLSNASMPESNVGTRHIVEADQPYDEVKKLIGDML